MDFTKLWDKTYLLGPNPLELQRSDKIFFVIALVFVLIGLATKIVSFWADKDSPKRFLLSRLFHLFLTSGVLILFWFSFRFENIPMLSTRVVVLSLFIIWFVWLIFTYKYFFKEYRVKQRLWEEEQVKNKYLPHAS